MTRVHCSSIPIRHPLGTFVEGAVGSSSTAWNQDKLRSIAQLNVPEFLLGVRQEILRADIHIVWARWFAEALGDPIRFPDSVDYGTVYASALNGVKNLKLFAKSAEQRYIASKVADALLAAVQRRARAKRKVFSQGVREDLLERSGYVPRCWMCGYAFEQLAIAKFRRNTNTSTVAWRLPRFVDYMRPTGLVVRDLTIEVDHVVAIAGGGSEGENLRLACGWCNRYKSDLSSIYDLAFEPRSIKHPRLGHISVPQPFWVVRLLAVRRVCEVSSDCHRCVDTDQMVVAPREPKGAANPCNLIVCCSEHDPLRSQRLIDCRLFEIE
jgi:HNH endonuclease